MVKRGLLILALAAFAATGVFAQMGFSAGAGAYFGGGFGGGMTMKLYGLEYGLKTPYYGGGGFFFADATYVEASLGIIIGGGEWEEKSVDNYNRPVTQKYDVSGTAVDIGLMVKYPYFMSEQLAVFPLLGITYRAMVSAKMDDQEANDPGDFSALWVKLGGGMDYSFSGNLFLRGEVLYGLRFKNQYEKDLIKYAEAEAAYYGVGADVKSRLGHGPDIKLAIGYKL